MNEFQVSKDNFSVSRLVEIGPINITDDEILLQVNNFALTANNITYAVLGEQLRYWQFFPPSDTNTESWGVIPVWGFATVIESKTNEVPVGERLFGYFPPASILKMKPVNVSKSVLFDGSAHRAELPTGYNIYRRVLAEENYDASMDRERMLLYPLHLTSFCIHDLLQDNDWHGAEQVIIVSASSKTSIGLAYACAADDNAPRTIGITSERNLVLVNSLGLYDSSITYDQLSSIDANKATVIIDMSANGEVLGNLHTHLANNMRFCLNVGATHWEDTNLSNGFNHERSEKFFVPQYIQQRLKEWGPAKFQQKTSGFIFQSALKSRKWLEMKEIDGLVGMADVYADVVAGNVRPEQGLIIEV